MENTLHSSCCELSIIKMVYECAPGTAAVAGMQFTSAIGELYWPAGACSTNPSVSDLYLSFHTKA